MSELKIDPRGKVAFVTGSNRGIGRSITVALLENGASKVYAGARDTTTLSSLKQQYGDRLVPIELDVTNEDTISRAAETANDVNILINNAGVLSSGGFFDDGLESSLETNLSVNVWGLVKVSKAFVNTLRNGSSNAIVNLSSVAGLANMPMLGTYSASKAAVHSITQGMRGELAEDDIRVLGVYPGPIDTDMAAGFPMEKATPEYVANQLIDALRTGVDDVFPDPMALQSGATYASEPKQLEKEFGAWVGATV
jgi:NAD(P)-dependent dehydrogenase (short-subunit alcohol dehydrogenase family)